MAQDKTMVMAKVNKVGKGLLQSVNKEIEDLHELLYDDETIHAAASGLIEGNNWLLTVTEKRILLTYHGMLGGLQKLELPLGQIKSVSVKSGLLMSDLLIDTGGQTKKITHVAKVSANDVSNTVSRLLHEPVATQQATVADDPISKLERLVVLHEKGVLTDEEFFAQKAVLFGSTATPESVSPATSIVPDPAPVPETPPAPEPESEAPASPVPPQKMKSGFFGKLLKIMGGIAVALFVLGLVVDNFAPSKDKTSSAPVAVEQVKEPATPLSAEEQLATYLAAVKAVDRSITDVQLWSQGNGGKTLGIFYTKDIAFKVFYTIGMNCENISKELVKNRLIDDNTTVLYFVHVPTVDKLGNEGTGLAMKISWSGSVLQKINWKNMFSPAFMNLCESVELSHLLRQDFVEFAQDKDNQKDFNDFIRTVLATNKSL